MSKNVSVQSGICRWTSLVEMNTLRLPAEAHYFCRVKSLESVQRALTEVRDLCMPVLALGEGSNLVLRQKIEALVIKVEIPGINIIDQDEAVAIVEAGAGVNWHQLVKWSLDHDLAGLENLSLIPGTVGAAPIQNIGAYGRELEQSFDSLGAVNIVSGEVREFNRSDCAFGYRQSIFKGSLHDQYIITSVRFRLNKNFQPVLHYPRLAKELQTIVAPTARQVSEAVCLIRRRKLPDPAVVGNVGSFFKNPLVDKNTAGRLSRKFPDLPQFTSSSDVKVSAAWMIEHCGWKGHRTTGGAGVYDHHALVLINSDVAAADSILALANDIQDNIAQVFGVQLELEPRIYPDIGPADG